MRISCLFIDIEFYLVYVINIPYMETLLTVNQVASTLQVHWQTVLTYIKSGKLRAVKLGRGYRIDSKDLEKFVESLKTT